MTEIKKTPIPQRLKNVSNDHPYVAGSIDIVDDVDGRSQQEINADTYRKNETYSKEQLNSMITTPEQKYENYTATAETTAISDLLPEEGEPDTTYRIGCWDGTEYNTGKFAEYSWDAENEEYIPLSIQDYGIDKTPVDGSTKFIESGGVYNAVQEGGYTFFLDPYNNGTSNREVKYWRYLDTAVLKSICIQITGNNLQSADNNVFGVFIKYGTDEETEILLAETPSEIPNCITVELDSTKTVTYLRISAYNPSGGTITGVIEKETWTEYYTKTLATKGIIVTKDNGFLKEALEVIKDIRIVNRGGDISSFYGSDGIKTLYLRGVNVDWSGTKGVGIRGSLIPDGKWLYDTGDGVFADTIATGVVLQVTLNNSTTVFNAVDGFMLDMEKLVAASNIDNESYITKMDFDAENNKNVLPDDSRLDDKSTVWAKNSYGYWTLRYSTDSFAKNGSGEGYGVSLGVKTTGQSNHGLIINGTTTNNAIIDLNNKIRTKSVTVEFEAKVNQGSESSSLGVALGGVAVKTLTLTGSWVKYTCSKDLSTQDWWDNTVTAMLYNPVADETISFSVRNVSIYAEDMGNDFPNAKYKLAALERGKNVQYVIGLLGDSWTQHSWNKYINEYSPAHSNYVQPLTQYLRKMYGDAGGGFYSFSTSHGGQAKMGCADPDDADDTRGGTITYRDQVSGVMGVDAADAAFSAESWLKLNIKTPHNKFKIHFYGDNIPDDDDTPYYDRETSGVFTYSVDGGEAVEVDTTDYTGHSTIEVSVPLGKHEIDFEVTSGSVMLFGVDMQRNNPGVRVHKIGNKGAFTSSYVDVETVCWKSIIGSLEMDSITVLLGINDGGSSTSVGDNLVTIINNIKAASPYIDTCIISPSNTKTDSFYAVRKQEREAAEKTLSKFIDLIPIFGASAAITATGKFYDNLHPTLNGGKAIADKIISELFPYPKCGDFSKTMLSVPFEINRHKCIKTNGTVNENTDQYDIWRYEAVPGDYYLIDAYRDAEQTTYVVNWMDEGGNFIDHELQNNSTTSDLTWEEFIVKAPGNAKYLFLNVRSGYNSKHNVKTLSDGCISPLKGKKIAVIGDSISTNGKTGEDSNVPEIVIQSEDVGVSLSAYITATDVADGLSINGTTYTSSNIGTKVTFTPALADVGKKVGVPLNYNSNSVKTWWEWMKDYFECDVIPVCWSGSSITSHEGNKNDYKASYAWHESQITKCGVRTPGTMDRTAPDIIIIYRGTNDMTHTSGSTSPFTPDVVLTDDYFKGIVTCPANDTVSGGYGFKEAYYKTISALRAAYPKAEIVLCTLSPFKRIHYGQFPTNNGVNSIPDYNNAIREIAEYMGCRVIEFDKAGITFENMYPTYISDSATIPTHPNDFGHLILGKCAIEKIENILI